MKEEKNKRIMTKLTLLWEKHPNFTLTQLLWTLAKSKYVFYYVEDDYIEQRIDRYLLKEKISDD